MIEKKIDAVIVAGWRVLETDFNESAFQEWRKQALDCVVALCGESHPYTNYFRRSVHEARTSSVLTGVGLLTAAQSGETKVNQVNGDIEAGNSWFVAPQECTQRNRGSSSDEVRAY